MRVMPFSKRALVAIFAIAAGSFAFARPVPPGECGIGYKYDTICTPKCSTLPRREMHECCEYKISGGIGDPSCADLAPLPSAAPQPAPGYDPSIREQLILASPRYTDPSPDPECRCPPVLYDRP